MRLDGDGLSRPPQLKRRSLGGSKQRFHMIVLLLSLCSLLPQTPDSTVARVYAVVVDSFFVHPGIQRLLVRPRTTTGVGHIDDIDYSHGLAGLGQLPAGLQADFQSHRLERNPVPSIPTRVPTTILDDSMTAALPRTDPDAFWNAFERRFPGANGIIALSPVGFSTDRRAAMVMVDFGCGGLCGGTVYYLLTVQNGRWVVIRSVQVRVS